MTRTPVSSSMLVSVGYDATNKVLEIEFTDGQIYDYQNVPQETFNDLMSSTSKGHYFRGSIKNQFSTNETYDSL